MRAPLAIISTILLYLPAISLVWYEVKYWGIYSWQELPIKFLFLGKLLFSDSYSPEMGNLAHHWQSVPLSRTCEPCQLIPSASLLILADGQQEITCSLLPACPRLKVSLTSVSWCCLVLRVILTRPQCTALLSAWAPIILNGHMLVSACFPCP